MARINLSIPDETKEQMDKFPSENWSKVALEAFLTRIKLLKIQEVDMDAAGLERLRASRASNGEREYAEGVQQGKRWALHKAQYDELKRVADLADVEFDVTARDLGAAVMDELDVSSANEGLEYAFSQEFRIAWPSDERVNGFIEGATAVFNEV